VSEAIKSLEGRGILARMRGLIKILDRERLEQISCRCYRNIRLEQDNPPRFRTVPLPFIGLPFFLLAIE
jgi:hypothetical protein